MFSVEVKKRNYNRMTGGIQMTNEHLTHIDGMDSIYVEYRHEDYHILFIRFERIECRDNPKTSENTRFLYFIYIFRKNDFVDKKSDKREDFNILCFNRVFHTYDELRTNANWIVGEYVLSKQKKFKILQMIQKLDPKYYTGRE
jgi:hypothetical protein